MVYERKVEGTIPPFDLAAFKADAASLYQWLQWCQEVRTLHSWSEARLLAKVTAVLAPHMRKVFRSKMQLPRTWPELVEAIMQACGTRMRQ